MKKIIISLSIFSILVYAGLKEDIAKEDVIKQKQNLLNENIKLMKEVQAKYFNEFCNAIYISSEVDFTEMCRSKKKGLYQILDEARYPNEIELVEANYAKEVRYELSKFYDDADKLPDKVQQIEANYGKEVKDFFIKTVSEENRLDYKKLLITEAIVNEIGEINSFLPDVKNELNHYKEVIKADYRIASTYDSKVSSSFTAKISDSVQKLYGDKFGELSEGEQKYILDNQEVMRRITQTTLDQYGRARIPHNLRADETNMIEFYLYPDGHISDIKFLKNSKFPILDDTTKESIEIAYTKYPHPVQKTYIRYRVSYNLN